MRRWLLALLGVVLLLGIGLLVAARNLDAYLNANRDAIARQAADALGREVHFGEVGISLRGGLAVKVADLQVGDDPAFASEPFLTTDAVEVRIAIWPALRGRIEVERVVLRRPVIRVIQTAQGLSTARLGGGGPKPTGAVPAGPAPRGELLVALVDIEDGTLRFVDRTQQPAVETAIGQLDFRASDVSLDAPVGFEMEAAVLGAERPNLRVSGRVGPVSAAEPHLDLELTLSPLDLAVAFATPPLAGSLPSDLAGAGNAKLELTAKGTAADVEVDAKLDARDAELRRGGAVAKAKGRPLALSLRAHRRGSDVEIERCDLVVDEMQIALHGRIRDLASRKLELAATSPALFPAVFGAGAPGDALRDVSLEGSLSFPSSGPRVEARLRSAKGSVAGTEYQDLALELRLAGGRLEIQKLALAAFEGRLTASGSADLRSPDRPAFEARADVDGMRLERLLARWAPSSSESSSGRIVAHLEVRGAGGSWPAIEPTLAGGGEVSVAEGVLRGFNPAGQAMQALVDLPVLSGGKLAPVIRAHPQVFGAQDTPFETIASHVEIADREVVARDARLVARDWDVRGSGRYQLDGHLHSNAVMAFSQPLSAELIDAEKRLHFLRSQEGQVEFPVVIRSKQDGIKVEPDLAYIASTASREAVTDLVDRALLGKKHKSGAEPAPPDSGQAPAPASPQDVGRDLLRGLGGLLGRKHEPQ